MGILADFRRAWDVCAGWGECDNIDGAEYRRVESEWLSAGRPAYVFNFIRCRANIGPATA